MELLLNLAWLLLALPAYWLWRDCRGFRLGRRSSLQCLLSLGCLLVILFPVISATDDLHLMRAEMEESSTSKRSVTQKSAEKASGFKWHHQPLLAAASIPLPNCIEGQQPNPVFVQSIPPAPTVTPIGRAPPASLLA